MAPSCHRLVDKEIAKESNNTELQLAELRKTKDSVLQLRVELERQEADLLANTPRLVEDFYDTVAASPSLQRDVVDVVLSEEFQLLSARGKVPFMSWRESGT